jgi:2-aminoethylphosphonate-pyruvate transaminase
MDEHVMTLVVAAAKQTLNEMGVISAAPPAAALDERKKLTEIDDKEIA